MSAPHYTFDGFQVDLGKRLLLRDGEVVPLTAKVFDTLVALIESRGEAISKEQLLERVWPDAVVSEGSLAQNISVLRKALGEAPGEHRYIVTVPRHGYRFVAPLTRADSPAVEPAPGARKTERRSWWRGWRPISAAVLVLTFLWIEAERWGFDFGFTSQPPPIEVATEARPSAQELEALRLYAEGLEQLHQFRFQAAEQRLTQAADLTPRSPLIQAALSRAWAGQGLEARAVETAEHAFELATPLPPAERLRIEAQLRESQQDWARAADLYRSLLTFLPEDLDIGLRLSVALRRSGRAEEALELLDQLQTRTQAVGAPEAATRLQPRLEFERALVLKALGRTEEALGAAQQAGRAAQRRDQPLLTAMAWTEEAVALSNLGRVGEALARLEEAVPIIREEGDPSQVAVVYNTVAVVYARQGRLDKARQLYEQALETFEQAGHRRGIASQLTNLGMLYNSQGELELASTSLERAVEIFRDIGDLPRCSLAHSGLGSVRRAQGDLDGARQAHLESLRLAREAGHLVHQLSALNNLAILDMEAGHLRRAYESLQSMLELSGPGDRSLTTAAAKLNSAEILLQLGEPRPARTYYEESRTLLEELGHDVDALQAVGGLATLALEQGRVAEAAELSEFYLRRSREFQAHRQIPAALGLEAQIARERGDPETARALLEEALEIIASADPRPGSQRLDLHLQLARCDLSAGSARAALRRIESDVDATLELDGTPAGSPTIDYATRVEAALVRAEAHLQLAAPATALAAVERAHQLTASSENFLLQAEVQRVQAEVAAALGRGEQAEVELQALLRESERAGLERLELELRLALARVYLARGSAEAGSADGNEAGSADRNEAEAARRLLLSVAQEADDKQLYRLAAEARKLL